MYGTKVIDIYKKSVLKAYDRWGGTTTKHGNLLLMMWCKLLFLLEGSRSPRRMNNYFWTAGQFISPIFKDQVVQEEGEEFFQNCWTLEDGKDSFCRKGGNLLPSYVA